MILNKKVEWKRGWVNTQGAARFTRKNIMYDGMVARVKVGEAVEAGDVLYQRHHLVPDWRKAKADGTATSPGMAYALEDGGANAIIEVLLQGYIYDDSVNWGVLANGIISIDGTVENEDYFIINGVKFEFTTTAGVLSDENAIEVDVSASALIAAAKIAWVAALDKAITDGIIPVTRAEEWSTNDLTLTSKIKGYAGNEITLVNDGAELDVSGEKMTNGVEGGTLYLSAAAAGGIVTSMPDSSGDQGQALGYALMAEEFIFNPSYDIIVGD